ncbi:MAG: lipoyl domain-containing protein [Candidatus Omnitrophota bacterium]|nr:lipoyl domain-containing protein [Candidatus Omnitrophota bacterium]MDZ4241304.1 lipoyl domain-containing protein [Candidatus Omnitrophota bacterium]
MTEVLLPELGEGIEKATVACWHVKPGDEVRADDDIVELVTDKATFNVPAGASGIVEKILVEEGADAPIGSPLALIRPATKT